MRPCRGVDGICRRPKGGVVALEVRVPVGEAFIHAPRSPTLDAIAPAVNEAVDRLGALLTSA